VDLKYGSKGRLVLAEVALLKGEQMKLGSATTRVQLGNYDAV